MMTHAAAAFLLLAGMQASPERVINCAETVQEHNEAAERIAGALQNYANCLESDRLDDCSGEFGRLRSAQNELERTVASVRRTCPEDQLQAG